MAVHSKNPTFAEEQKAKIMESVAASTVMTEAIKPTTTIENNSNFTQTVTQENYPKKKTKDVLIGIHVTEDERTELRQMFCSNGFSLATAYRAAMSYLRQDIELGKAYITNNGEIRRR